MMTVTVVGLAEAKARLLAMSAASNQRVLQMSLERRGRVVKDMIAAKAPVGKAPRDPHPGRLRAGVVLNYLRGGVGYCKFVVTVTRLAYYGVFQELGLGGKVSARTAKRYAQYEFSKGVQAGLRQRGITPEEIIAAKLNRTPIPGLSRRELRRQYTLAKGRRLQGGGRRRSMAAQPFFRPVRDFVRNWFITSVFNDVWTAIAAEEARTGKK
ncbi:MAG: hypothetical protein EPN53_01005 [Acidobacteria bacterium]|nr:MAG: hypothetical protein EPN53_01005 [Acidobacteriota bacterium]